MSKTAQWGNRFGEGVETEDLEQIYEFTYKLQMLNQEERLGDFGLPTLLPDRAYIEKSKVEAQLEEKLNEVFDTMTQVYDNWIAGHEPQIEEYYERATEYWNERRWEVENSSGHIGDIGDILGTENVKGTIVEYL